MTPNCNRCNGIMEYREDAYGPYWACFLGCTQVDLYQPSPAELDLLVKVHSHGSNNPRDDAGSYQAHNVAGIKQKAGQGRPRRAEFYNKSNAFNLR